MSVFIYIYIHVFVYRLYTYTHMYIVIYVFIYTYACVVVHTPIHHHAYPCVLRFAFSISYLHAYIKWQYIRLPPHIYVRKAIHIYTDVHTFIQSYTVHTYIQSYTYNVCWCTYIHTKPYILMYIHTVIIYVTYSECSKRHTYC